jgi:hypothetical protein
MDRGKGRVVSGVSELSTRDAFVQRESGSQLGPINEVTGQSPVSPTTLGDGIGEEYLTAIVPLRKSFFKENTEDMNE